MPKAKETPSSTVRCSCGCGDNVSKRTQTRHLQGRGPVMAVAGVIEAKAYFRKRGAEAPESLSPQKRQRVAISTPESCLPQTLSQEQCLPDSAPPAPSPALPVDPVTSKAARTALSTPWTGPAGFCYGDDEVFEGSNDIANDTVRLDPIIEDTCAESESSDTDSGTDIDDDESSGSDMEGVPDIFETNADLNEAEHSE